jgi:hypothetical protein
LGWWPGEISNETFSLMEAYCDIMGELCEDEPDWMVAADVFKDMLLCQEKGKIKRKRQI